MALPRAHGVVYTPDDLARHVVARTLGAYLREHQGSADYESRLHNVTVLDPACGDGAFLIPVFDLLLAERRRLAPRTDPARDILTRNIFGADLDPEAVQAARRRLARHAGTTDISLDRTIVTGHSLIDDPAVAGPAALSWPGRFPRPMAQGGFDVVLGNPPYVNARTADPAEKAYLRERYPHLRGAYDLYVAFLLRGRELLRDGGRYGWIVPNKFLVADYAAPARDLLTRDSLQAVEDVSAQGPFRAVNVYPVLLFGQAGRPAPVPPAPATVHPTLAERGFKIHAGTTGFAAHAVKALLNTDGRGLPFAVSGSVDPYRLDTSAVRFLRDTYAHPHLELGSPAVAASKYRFWQRPKIVVAGMTRRIEAVYTERPLALGVGAYGICDLPGYDPYAVTAVLNSDYMSAYLRAHFHHKHLSGGYLALNKSTLEQLPMADPAALDAADLPRLSRRLHEAPDPALAADVDAIVARLFAAAP